MSVQGEEFPHTWETKNVGKPVFWQVTIFIPVFYCRDSLKNRKAKEKVRACFNFSRS